MRLLIVDDHALLAESLAAALACPETDVTIVPSPNLERVLAIAEVERPEVVLLDLELGDDVGRSTAVVPSLVELGACVVVLTGSTDGVALAECIEAGAAGIVGKNHGFTGLVEMLDRVIAGDTSMFERQRHELLFALRRHRSELQARTAPLRSLTRRECEVLAGLERGRNAQELADEMYVSLATVRSQIQSILRKLDVSSQLAAVAEARRAGFDFSGYEDQALTS
jgi:DNA-binding NarL/FixJ family response regulator